ncbi:hypothetical protein CAI21_11605 [Alkalilimnicola ehrlichii]|uniref:ABC transporter substrate-binding protein n=1 Tax=Alkalilimnicola ehrlichii TaxID=351052 RepID=UPI000E38EA99|nr:ABC transporter substrate-binding protein [Alkalilimnicola ehrlichii]RFA28514.1 hypothetical protein CAI21_11605 [Alkalilimnicola ehrlichii]
MHSGGQSLAGALLARDQINAEGGINVGGVHRPIELIQVDSNEMVSIADAVARLEQALAAHDIDFIIGGFRSEAVLAMQDLAMEHETIFLGTGAAHGDLGARVEQDYEFYKYWFRLSPIQSEDLGRQVFAYLRPSPSRYDKTWAETKYGLLYWESGRCGPIR